MSTPLKGKSAVPHEWAYEDTYQRSMTLDEVFSLLPPRNEPGDGDMEVWVVVPYEDGVGYYMERITNIFIADGVINISIPQDDRKGGKAKE